MLFGAVTRTGSCASLLCLNQNCGMKKKKQQQTNHVSEYLLFVSECSRSQGQEAFSWVVGYIFT